MDAFTKFGGNEYRLGDLVHGYIAKHFHINETYVFCSQWPDSIGCEYALLKTKKKRDYSTFLHIVNRRIESARYRHANECLAPPHSLVVHLRLGDVFDWPQKYNCKFTALHGVRGCHYAPHKNKYKALLHLSGVRQAIVVSDPLYRSQSLGHAGASSFEYMNEVCDILRRRFRVIQFYNRSADCDLLTLSSAHVMASRRSGFALLAQMVADYRNAHIVQL